jgi:hypothetical protein
MAIQQSVSAVGNGAVVLRERMVKASRVARIARVGQRRRWQAEIGNDRSSAGTTHGAESQRTAAAHSIGV